MPLLLFSMTWCSELKNSICVQCHLDEHVNCQELTCYLWISCEVVMATWWLNVLWLIVYSEKKMNRVAKLYGWNLLNVIMVYSKFLTAWTFPPVGLYVRRKLHNSCRDYFPDGISDKIKAWLVHHGSSRVAVRKYLLTVSRQEWLSFPD